MIKFLHRLLNKDKIEDLNYRIAGLEQRVSQLNKRIRELNKDLDGYLKLKLEHKITKAYVDNDESLLEWIEMAEEAERNKRYYENYSLELQKQSVYDRWPYAHGTAYGQPNSGIFRH